MSFFNLSASKVNDLLKYRRKTVYSFLLIIIIFISSMMVPGVRMRTHVAFLQSTGQITDISWTDLLEFMKPSSGVSVGFLIERKNPHAAIRNPWMGENDVQAGSLIYLEKCAVCHGSDGRGSVASPALAGGEFKHGISDWALYRNIKNGIPETAMISQGLNNLELWQLVAFIRTLNETSLRNEKFEIDEVKSIDVSVSAEELLQLDHPENDWLTYSGSYRSNRNSRLKQINNDNVQNLNLKWIHQFKGKYGRVQASPIERDGVMYLTVPPDRLIALDALTGEEIWDFQYDSKAKVAYGGFSGKVNRGVAILDDKIYVATSDAKLISLNANTGQKIWETSVEDDLNRYSISGAPLAFNNIVVTGVTASRISNAETRGSINAYDALTGELLWKFYSVPGPDQEGNDTWSDDSWLTGGASTWLTGSYDAENDILYWGIGNPKPDYIKSLREGDNLYSNSVVALRGSTGEILWHFQFTPGDDHDWDSVQIPILADLVIDGEERELLLWANRNGFYYVLDRISGKFVTATPFVYQNWADGMDVNGRPILTNTGKNSRDGVLVFPSNTGGTSWWSPSFDPNLKLTFVPVVERSQVFFPGMDVDVAPISAGGNLLIFGL